MDRRISFLQRFLVAGLAVIWAGLFSAQILQGHDFRRKSEINRTRLIHLPAPRGAILDRHGVPLVQDQVGFELAVLPQELKDPNFTWGRLQSVTGISADLLSQRYALRLETPFSLVPLIQHLSAQEAFALEEKRWGIPGTLVRPVPERRYGLGPALGPVVGHLGLIDPMELTHLTPYGYTFRDWVGKDGLEQRYDRFLRGQDGGLQIEVDARGRMVRQLGYLPPRAGGSITISLDGRLQAFCYELLHEKEGAIIVMDPSTGEILALVSRPSFDPAAFLDSTKGKQIHRYLRHPDWPMFNRAIRSAVAPGSTFKVAVAYEALAEEKIQPHTTFECLGSYPLGRGLFHCWKQEGHGPQTVGQALEHSCNIFFFQAGRRLKAEGIGRAARLFGLGRRTGIDLPREENGFVPDPHWMRQTLKQPWMEGDTVSFAIGQGPLLVTPLQMVSLVTAIAMGGQMPQPHLIKKMEGQKDQTVRRPRPIPVEPEALAWVKKGMEEVVASPSGTGRLAQLAGVQVAAKTGTAQVSRGISHAWYMGYAPAQKPRVSFVVFLEHGGKGGEQAAWVARDLLVYLKELEYL